MAKFDLKFSNIVKVVLVILLVVGLYNLVYNSNVFNYSMYEGFTPDQIPKILDTAIDNAINMYKNVVDIADKASQIKLTKESDIQLLVDAVTGTFQYIAKSNDSINGILTTLPDNLDDNTKQIIFEIKHSSGKAIDYAKMALNKAQDLNKDVKTTITAFNKFYADNDSSNPDAKTVAADVDNIKSDSLAIQQDISGYISDLAAVVENANIVVKKLNDLKTSMQVSKEGFDNLYPSNVDQSINCSLMQPYASYKCGPINPAKFFFDNIEFKPDCCPSTYSSSQGCACLCPQQINYLNSRGGNRTFPTQF